MKPTRIIIAMVLFAGLWSAGAWAAGSNPEPDVEPIPVEFSMPAMQIGDSASYQLFHVADSTNGPYAGLEFTWDPKTPMFDGTGKAYTTTPISMSFGEWQYNSDQDWEWTLAEPTTIYLVEDDMIALSVGFDVIVSGSSNADVLGVGLIQSRSDADWTIDGQVYLPHPTPAAMRPCPATNLVAGNTIDPSEPQQLFGACWMYSSPAHNLTEDGAPAILPERNHPRSQIISLLDREFTAAHTQIVDGAVEIAFVSEGDEPWIVWLRDDSPYPAQIAIPYGGGHDVYVLTDYDSGEPASLKESAPLKDAPPLAWAPAEKYGLNESGTSKYFTPRKAIEDAQQDEEIAAFFSDHPNARMVGLDSSIENRFDVEETLEWKFLFADEAAKISFSVRRGTTDHAILVRELTGQDLPEITNQRFDFEWYTDFNPTLLSLPMAQQPTAATALATSKAFLGREPGGWSMTLVCGNSYRGECVEASYAVTMGTSSLESKQPEASGTSVYAETTYADDHLTLGDPEFPVQNYFRIQAKGQQTAGPTPMEGEAEVHAIEQATVTKSWDFPSAPVLVGTGFMAALIAALYLFFPYLKMGAIGMFSRVQSHTALDNPTRRKLYDTVQASPGIHFQEIARTVDAGRNTVDHHLRKLVHTGQIIREDGAGYSCYFPRKTDRRIVAAAPSLRSETARKVLAVIAAKPGLSGGELADLVGINRGTLSHHVKRLETAGVLEGRRQGRGIHYWATATGHAMSQRQAA